MVRRPGVNPVLPGEPHRLPRLRPPSGSGAGSRTRAAVVPRIVRIAGRRTSVRLEPAFWQALMDLAAAEGLATTALLDRIAAAMRPGITLTAALRVVAITYWRDRAAGGQQRSHHPLLSGILAAAPPPAALRPPGTAGRNPTAAACDSLPKAP